MAHTVSSLSCATLFQTPLLMFSIDQEDNSDDIQRFYSLVEDKSYTIVNMFKDLSNAWHMGSSHDWMHYNIFDIFSQNFFQDLHWW